MDPASFLASSDAWRLGVAILLEMEIAMSSDTRFVLVTGATGGLGSAVVRAFLEAGAHVIATYRNAADFQTLAENHNRTARLEGVAISPDARVAVMRDLTSNQMLHLATGMKHQGWELTALTDTVATFGRGDLSVEFPLVEEKKAVTNPTIRLPIRR